MEFFEFAIIFGSLILGVVLVAWGQFRLDIHIVAELRMFIIIMSIK